MNEKPLLVAGTALGAAALAICSYLTYSYVQKRNRFRAVLKPVSHYTLIFLACILLKSIVLTSRNSETSHECFSHALLY